MLPRRVERALDSFTPRIGFFEQMEDVFDAISCPETKPGFNEQIVARLAIQHRHHESRLCRSRVFSSVSVLDQALNAASAMIAPSIGHAETQPPQSMQREWSTSTMDRRSAAAEREIASVGHMAMQFPEHSQRNVVKAVRPSQFSTRWRKPITASSPSGRRAPNNTDVHRRRRAARAALAGGRLP